MDKEELEIMYWGPNRLPPEWKSIQDCADACGLAPKDILEMMDRYGITVRTQEMEVQKRYGRY